MTIVFDKTSQKILFPLTSARGQGHRYWSIMIKCQYSSLKTFLLRTYEPYRPRTSQKHTLSYFKSFHVALCDLDRSWRSLSTNQMFIYACFEHI